VGKGEAAELVCHFKRCCFDIYSYPILSISGLANAILNVESYSLLNVAIIFNQGLVLLTYVSFGGWFPQRSLLTLYVLPSHIR